MSILVVSLVAFVLGFVGSMPLAGPVSVMVVSRAALGRFGDALKLAVAASVAEGLYASLAFWGFATVVVSHPTAALVSRCLTVLVLLSVGVHFARWSPKPETPAAERPEARKWSGHGDTILGFTTSILNPTLLVTWSAVATAIYARAPAKMTSSLAIPFGLSAAAGIAGWNIVLVAVLRRYTDRFPRTLVVRVIRGMGLLLIAIALWTGIGVGRELGARFTRAGTPPNAAFVGDSNR